jgi:hypothetical protein
VPGVRDRLQLGERRGGHLPARHRLRRTESSCGGTRPAGDARRTPAGGDRSPSRFRKSRPTANPQARISSTVGRLHRQPPAKRRHGWNSLSWHAARNRELARTCSTNSNCPSGRSKRAISPRVRSASLALQRTSVETTVSTDASVSGRRSAGASTIRATRPCRCRRRSSLRRIAASGSVSTSSAIPSG